MNKTIKVKNTFNFGFNIWFSGKVVLIENSLYIISKQESVNVGDAPVLQIRRRIFELKEKIKNRAEKLEYNELRNSHKIIVFPHQITKEDEQNLHGKVGEFVLVKCYPNMGGPGQYGWVIDNDIEGKSNKVILHY